MKSKYYTKQTVESIACGRLTEYGSKVAPIDAPPVPVELLAEHLFDLRISWESIEEASGDIVLGALRPHARQIVLNERRVADFEGSPGLEAFTIGHELGHWDLFTDHGALHHPQLPGIDHGSQFAKRSGACGEVEIIQLLVDDDAAYAEFKRRNRGKDTHTVRVAVDRYASSLLMPEFLIVQALKPILERWDEWSSKPFGQQAYDVYQVREKFAVTISALQVRLESLNMLSIDWDNRRIYRNKSERMGQTSLF